MTRFFLVDHSIDICNFGVTTCHSNFPSKIISLFGQGCCAHFIYTRGNAIHPREKTFVKSLQ